MTRLDKLLYQRLYKISFYDFVKDFWQEADPAPFVDGDLVQYYCEVFQYMSREWVGYEYIDINLDNVEGNIIDVRQGKNNLCLMVPPRHSKSMIFNVMGPVWLWLSHPIKAVSISHTGKLAAQMNTKRQRIINSKKFIDLFDNVQIHTNTTTHITDTRGGELFSLNRNAFTGYGGDIIINDDLTNAETARKDKAEMQNAWEYYQNTMPSRINNPEKSIIMNIQQRLAPNDVAGHIMNDPQLSSRYVFITLPAIFQEDTTLVFPITGKIKFYKAGDALWPERFKDNYEGLRAEVGESVFETQYLQNPIATDRTVIKQNMIVVKSIKEVPEEQFADMVYSSSDFPVKDKETSDFLGSVLGYRVGSTLYIKRCFEKKMAFPASIEYIRKLDETFPGMRHVIEDKANGSPILQQLQDEISGMYPYDPGTNSKFQRLESASLYMDIGNVVFVASDYNSKTGEYVLSHELDTLVKRLTNYPFVEHDDIVDAFSMLVLFVFLDKRFSVYARTFNDKNIIKKNLIPSNLQTTTFFNREGDRWKVSKIGIHYLTNTIYVQEETEFKASIKDAVVKFKEFSPKEKVFIDCSLSDAMQGFYTKDVYIERYTIDEFEQSVAQLSLALSKSNVLLSDECVNTKGDIEMFKRAKTKDESSKYSSEKDGFVANIRVAMKYFGISL